MNAQISCVRGHLKIRFYFKTHRVADVCEVLCRTVKMTLSCPLVALATILWRVISVSSTTKLMTITLAQAQGSDDLSADSYSIGLFNECKILQQNAKAMLETEQLGYKHQYKIV